MHQEVGQKNQQQFSTKYSEVVRVMISKRRSTDLVFVGVVCNRLQVADQEFQSVIIMIWKISDLQQNNKHGNPLNQLGR